MKKNKLVTRVLYMTLFLVLFLIALGKFLTSYSVLLNGSSIDLRNRIVGTRVALLHKDPFQYQEALSGNVALFDPIAYPNSTFTRLSVSPALLLSHTILSFLPFSKIVVIWFFVEWVALITSVFLFAKISGGRQKAIYIIGLLFSGSFIWLLHLTSAQVYVLYVLMLAIIIYFAKQDQYFKAFFVLGILVVLRPPYLFIPLLLFSSQKFRSLFRPFFYGMLVTGGLSMIVFNPNIWSQYIVGMTKMSLSPAQIEISDNTPQLHYPKVIEGWAVSQESLGFSPEHETSVRGLVLEKTNFLLQTKNLLIMISLIALVFSVLVRYFKINSILPLIFTAVTLTIVSEYFLPARRYLYADIQWIVPVCLFISLFKPTWLKKLPQFKYQ